MPPKKKKGGAKKPAVPLPKFEYEAPDWDQADEEYVTVQFKARRERVAREAFCSCARKKKERVVHFPRRPPHPFAASQVVDLVGLTHEWNSCPTSTTVHALKNYIREKHRGGLFDVALYKDTARPPESLAWPRLSVSLLTALAESNRAPC